MTDLLSSFDSFTANGGAKVKKTKSSASVLDSFDSFTAEPDKSEVTPPAVQRPKLEMETYALGGIGSLLPDVPIKVESPKLKTSHARSVPEFQPLAVSHEHTKPKKQSVSEQVAEDVAQKEQGGMLDQIRAEGIKRSVLPIVRAGESMVEGLKGIPAAFTTPVPESNPDAPLVDQLLTPMAGVGRLASSVGKVGFGPVSSLFAPVDPEAEKVITVATNAIKATDPSAQVAPELPVNSIPDVLNALATPGAVSTASPVSDAIVDETAPLAVFSILGDVANGMKPKSGLIEPKPELVQNLKPVTERDISDRGRLNAASQDVGLGNVDRPISSVEAKFAERQYEAAKSGKTSETAVPIEGQKAAERNVVQPGEGPKTLRETIAGEREVPVDENTPAAVAERGFEINDKRAVQGDVPSSEKPRPVAIERYDEEGTTPDATKPHGAYFSLKQEGIESPHKDIGPVHTQGEVSGRNTLDVTPVKVQHARFRGATANSDGFASTGVAALKQLTSPAEFEQLRRMSKNQLVEVLSREFPGPDYGKYYDSYELLEALGAQRARKAGYDSLLMRDEQTPEFSEYVALTPDAYKSKPASVKEEAPASTDVPFVDRRRKTIQKLDEQNQPSTPEAASVPGGKVVGYNAKDGLPVFDFEQAEQPKAMAAAAGADAGVSVNGKPVGSNPTTEGSNPSTPAKTSGLTPEGSGTKLLSNEELARAQRGESYVRIDKNGSFSNMGAQPDPGNGVLEKQGGAVVKINGDGTMEFQRGDRAVFDKHGAQVAKKLGLPTNGKGKTVSKASASAPEALRDLNRTYGVTESHVQSLVEAQGLKYHNIWDTSVSRNGLQVQFTDPATKSSFSVPVEQVVGDGFAQVVAGKRLDFLRNKAGHLNFDKFHNSLTEAEKAILVEQGVGPAKFWQEAHGASKPVETTVVNNSPNPIADSASWVIRNKQTGEVIAETFDRKKVERLNTEKYEAVPIQQYLEETNKAIKEKNAGVANPPAAVETTPEVSPVDAKAAEIEALRNEKAAPDASGPWPSAERVAGHDGKETRVRIAGNDTPVNARYRVVELDSLNPSHSGLTFEQNPRYPVKQDRPYHSDKAEQAKVVSNAEKYDPTYTINTNNDAVNGPSIVTPDGHVLGGNSRVMTLQQLYNSGRGDVYRNYLADNAESFGVSAEQVRGMKNPVLVREVESPKTIAEGERAITDYNKVPTASLNPQARAVALGKKLTSGSVGRIGDMLRDLGDNDKPASVADLLRERPNEVLEILRNDGAVTQEQINGLIEQTPQGIKFTDDAKSIIGDALLGNILSDADLVRRTPLSVKAKVEAVLGELMNLKGRSEDGWNIVNTVKQAADDIYRASLKGMSLDDYYNQGGLFGDTTSNPLVEQVARKLLENQKSVKAAFRQFVQDSRMDEPGQGVLGLIAKPEPNASFADAFGGEALKPEQYGDALSRAWTERNGTQGITELFSGFPVHKILAEADKAISPLMQKIDNAITAQIGKLPFSVRRWLRENARVRQIIEEANFEIRERVSAADSLLRVVLRANPSKAEMLLMDRVARGVPADITNLRPELREAMNASQQKVQRLAMELTSERKALGLPIREEWLDAPKHWYPNLWANHEVSPRMVAGRIFGRVFRSPNAVERSSMKPRFTDKFAVVDGKGELISVDKSTKAIFDTKAEAERFMAEHGAYRVRYFEKGVKGVKSQSFVSMGERTKWVKKQGDNITIREMTKGPDMTLLEPMTHEQAVAHGLIEDVAANLQRGFGREWSLVARTKALETMGKEFAVAEPQPGYVSLADLGFEIPKDLADANGHIKALRDGYVPEDVGYTLASIWGKRGAAMTAFNWAEGSLRKMVTAYSPFRHIRQPIENHLLLSLADSKAAINFPSMERSLADFVRGNKGEANVPYWEEYNASHLSETDLFTGEFRTAFEHASQITTKNSPLSIKEKLAIWADQNKAVSKFTAGQKFMQDMYRAEDQVYKYYLYRTFRERGMKPDVAARRVQRSFFDYSDVPPIIRATNKIAPFITNVAYQYARILGTALRDRPATTTMKLGVAMAAYAALREQMFEQAGISEQDRKNMGQFQPDYWEFPIPITDKNGRSIMVNLSWMLPYSEVTMLGQAVQDEDVERTNVQLARRSTPMITQGLITALTARGAFGEKLLSGVEDKGEKRSKIAKAAALNYMPNVLGQYWNSLYKNATAGEAKKRPWWEVAAVAPVTGSIKRVRPQDAINIRQAISAGEIKKTLEEASRLRARMFRGDIDGEKYRESIDKLYGGLEKHGYIHPETLATEKAFEKFAETKDASGLKPAAEAMVKSGYYSNTAEASEALKSLWGARERLRTLSKTPLPETRDLLGKAIDLGMEGKTVDESTRKQLMDNWEKLSETDQKALAEWAEKEVSVRRKRRQAVENKPKFSLGLRSLMDNDSTVGVY